MDFNLEITSGPWDWEKIHETGRGDNVIGQYRLEQGVINNPDRYSLIETFVHKDFGITDDMILISKAPLLLEAAKTLEKENLSLKSYLKHIEKEIEIAQNDVHRHTNNFVDAVKTYFKLLDDMVERSSLCFRVDSEDKLEEAEKKLRELGGIS